jgi:hypothetical protein
MGHVENKKGVIYFTSKNSDFVRSIPELAPRKFDETCPKIAELRKLRSQ